MSSENRKLRVLPRRGTAEANNRYIGYPGEITYDTDNETYRIHNGTTPGGRKVVDEELVQAIVASSVEDITTGTSTHINAKTGTINGQQVTYPIDGEFGWRDITSEIRVSGGGRDNPSWGQFRNGIFAYEFVNGRSNEFWCTFHIDHDYALGTKVFPHVHWSVNSNASGTVRWGIEYTMAKGHQQGAGSTFGPTSVVYATTTVPPNSAFQHFISEVNEAQAIPPDQLEPDSLVLIRFFRDANNDTFNGTVYGFTADLHYQTARISTKNKSPNFYG